MNEPLSTRVTRINDRWHCRLMNGGRVIDEMACENQTDIGFCCYEMLRWYCKLGNTPYSEMANAAREREFKAAVGKVWYQTQLMGR